MMDAYDALPDPGPTPTPSFALVSEAVRLERTDPKAAEAVWERVQKGLKKFSPTKSERPGIGTSAESQLSVDTKTDQVTKNSEQFGPTQFVRSSWLPHRNPQLVTLFHHRFRRH